jgi:hypothetical protein
MAIHTSFLALGYCHPTRIDPISSSAAQKQELSRWAFCGSHRDPVMTVHLACQKPAVF